MKLPIRYRLTEDEKDALLAEQAALIERLAARIAVVGKPRKTSSNSHTPPSKDGPGQPPALNAGNNLNLSHCLSFAVLQSKREDV